MKIPNENVPKWKEELLKLIVLFETDTDEKFHREYIIERLSKMLFEEPINLPGKYQERFDMCKTMLNFCPKNKENP